GGVHVGEVVQRFGAATEVRDFDFLLLVGVLRILDDHHIRVNGSRLLRECLDFAGLMRVDPVRIVVPTHVGQPPTTQIMMPDPPAPEDHDREPPPPPPVFGIPSCTPPVPALP